jgi:hypothetical protein
MNLFLNENTTLCETFKGHVSGFEYNCSPLSDEISIFINMSINEEEA